MFPSRRALSELRVAKQRLWPLWCLPRDGFPSEHRGKAEGGWKEFLPKHLGPLALLTGESAETPSHQCQGHQDEKGLS